MTASAPSFLEQYRLEQVVRAVLRRAAFEATGREPSAEQLTERVRAEVPALHAEFGEGFLKRLAARSLSTGNDGAPPVPEDPPEAGVVSTWLTESQRKEAESALWYAKLHGIESIPEALKWHAVCNKAALSAPTIGACLDGFYIAKRVGKCASRTLHVYRVRLQRFASQFGSRQARSVTGKELAEYLAQWPNVSTRLTNWDTISTFFNWMVERRFLLENPLLKATYRPKKKTGVRLIFTPDETRQILSAVKNTDQAGFWALSLFAGMRALEIMWLQERPDPWKLVDLRRGVIDLSGYEAVWQRRQIPILPVLRAWLDWIKAFKVPFCPPNHWNKFKALRISVLAHRLPGSTSAAEEKGAPAKITAMARRSFIAYRLALAGASYVEISEQIGNKESFMRREFYQKASKPEGEIYFSLTPARVQVTPSGRKRRG